MLKFCSRPDIAYIVRVLGRYMSNLVMAHWKAAKMSFEILKEDKE